MPTNPLVSVILPVHNGEHFLGESIRSVLQQGYRPLELIVVDDGSTDGTADLVASFGEPVRCFRCAHGGPAAARNIGLREARGQFIAFIDADDLWPEDKLKSQMRCFELFPDVDVVQGLIRRVHLPGRVPGSVGGAELDFPFLYTNLGAMVMRRTVLDQIGDLDESLMFHEDTDFWLRAREAGVRVVVQRKVSLIYRIHGRNMTTGEDLHSTRFLEILKKSIDRRRAPSGRVDPVPQLTFLRGVEQSGDSAHAEGQGLRRPLVSVVLTVSNGNARVANALNSLRAQNYQPLELVVVGSGLDHIRALASDEFERVEWIEEHAADRAAQLNAGIAKCTGELVAFLDADSEWTPGKLSIQVPRLLSRGPGLDYTVGRTRHILQPGTRYPAQVIDGLAFRRSLGDSLGTLLAYRRVFDEVGGFATALPGMEETDWLLRARDAGCSHEMLPDVLLTRLVRADARVERTDRMKSALLEAVRASIRRKHAASA